MANVYVEPRPKGRSEGSPIDDYVVEDRWHIGTYDSEDSILIRLLVAKDGRAAGHSVVRHPVKEPNSDPPCHRLDRTRRPANERQRRRKLMHRHASR
jgi:hypothetical protein